MFWFNKPLFFEPKHVALDEKYYSVVFVIILLYLMSMWHWQSDELKKTDCSTLRTVNATLPTFTVPLYRHFATLPTVSATLPTFTVPLYRQSLCQFTDCQCHFTDIHCAALPTVIVPLYRHSLCHFTDSQCRFIDFHCATLPTVIVPLYRLSVPLYDCHCAILPTANLTWTDLYLTPIFSSERAATKRLNRG
jgi:hypothetical protein